MMGHSERYGTILPLVDLEIKELWDLAQTPSVKRTAHCIVCHVSAALMFGHGEVRREKTERGYMLSKIRKDGAQRVTQFVVVPGMSCISMLLCEEVRARLHIPELFQLFGRLAIRPLFGRKVLHLGLS